MKSLTIAYITAREKPQFEWFFDSLALQMKDALPISIIVVDTLADDRAGWTIPRGSLGRVAIGLPNPILHIKPKPTIWQGKHRITKEDWWAASNARNTAICLCQTEWIAFLDDRCVLMPTWLSAIRTAMKYGYAVCGSYEKRTGMTVENGVIKHGGIVIGEDSRIGLDDRAVKAPGQWFFGCTTALPLEWALAVNGYDETCDGLSMEDVIFGLMLQNNQYPIAYDKRMKIVEDRTPEEIGKPMRREDKGVSPNDKSHAMLNMLCGSKRAMHQWDLSEIRKQVLAGGPFPIPTEPKLDWYDGQPIAEFA